jgi:SAM-dependent methyltransferase
MEIDLLKRYPRTKRDLTKRSQKTPEDVAIARQFGQDFFDGDRKYGYGGFSYNPKYWGEVVKDFIEHYNLTKNSRVLDVGCAKGFMMYDLAQAMPGITVHGIDISEYAIKNCLPEMKPNVSVGNAVNILLDDNEYDLVISINTIHNLESDDCCKAIQEIERIGKQKFITVDAWRNEEEKQAMLDWNLTAQTMMSVDDWKRLFYDIRYTGDYYWFVP